MGYVYDPWVRFTPANGPPETWKLSEKFTDVGGPSQCRPEYVADVTRRTDVNRGVGQLHRGFRPRVRMVFDIFTIEDQAHYAKLLNRLRRPSEWTVELALDAGITWRPVLMARNDGPDPLGGKTFVGGKFVLDVEARSLIDDYPDMAADPAGLREFLSDPSFEAWNSGTVPTPPWIEDDGGTFGTVNQDATVLRTGNSACRIEKASGSAGNYMAMSQDRVGAYESLRYYRLSGWVRGSVGGSLTAELLLYSSPLYYSPLTGLWNSAYTNAARCDVTTTYALQSYVFQVDPSIATTAPVRIALVHRAPVGDLIYFDDVQIVGPVRPPGIAAW